MMRTRFLGRTRAVSLVAAGVLAAVTGCGSTAQSARTLDAGSAADAGLSTASGLGGVAGQAQGLGAGAGGGLAGRTSGVTGPTGVATGSTTTSAVPGGPTGGSGPAPVTFQGRTVTPIEVGITYVKDPAAGFQAIGVQGATLGDQKGYATAVVNDVNKHGGLGGRPISPVFYQYSADPGASTIPQQDQQACATLTQDHHVALAVLHLSGSDLVDCLQKRNVPMIEEGSIRAVLDRTLQRDSLYYGIGGFSLDRRSREQVRALVRQKYFDKWDNLNGGPSAIAPVKVGVITYNKPDWVTAADGPMTSALRAAGYPPETVVVASHDSYDQLGQMETQISAALLKFKADGVTHVIIMDDNGVATLFFMRDAQNQNYRPRYGITSGNNMHLLASGLVDPSQLTGATGIGWIVTGDTDAGKVPTGKYATPNRTRCNAVMSQAGFAGGSGYNEGSALAYCTAFDVLRGRWPLMSAPGPGQWNQVMDGLGSSYADPVTPATYVAGGRHDGLGGIYDYFYSASCKCMAYSAHVQPLQH
ncbi:MAG: hypothetical protein M3N21_01480 [Actinomycetota bacterium]|nr:hypothetical protein [Actinomycetota bacterium]